MPMQPIVDKNKNFTEAELILSYLIDNQKISGTDAIILLKAIIENQKKEPELTLFPRKEKTPVSTPSTNPLIDPYNPAITDSKPYNPLTDPMRIYCDNKTCVKSNIDNNTSITMGKVEPVYTTPSTGDSFFIPRELSI